ncbi:hypothetical protein GGD62_004228 [Bradyrhizobium sp. ERR14]|nr:hypothetical protein [Bradyrhizobium sp. ERR14]
MMLPTQLGAWRRSLQRLTAWNGAWKQNRGAVAADRCNDGVGADQN